MIESTLVLNASFEPLKIVHWQRAMVLWAQGKVEILAEHDIEKRAVTFSFKLPSVVRLLRFVRTRLRSDSVPFTRANIYRRDDFTCGYCGVAFESEDLTFDHVVPSSRGGKKDWTNIVTACLSCNRRKDNRTPEEAGMTLRHVPGKPKPSPVFKVSLGYRKMPESWRDFLYWNAELES